MRYSEGVKRYHEDTKKRIFDEIIAAVEAEKTADISLTDNTAAVIAEQEKEGITMNNTNNTNERAKITSSKGRIIAAACAVLVVGGVFAVNYKSGKVDVTPPGSENTSYTTGDEDGYADEITVPDVTGLDGEAAYDKLTAAGFEVMWKSTYDETVAPDTVAYTVPAANEKAAPGSVVTMYVSRGALDSGDGRWDGIDPAFAALVENADFVGEVRIVGSDRISIDGVGYMEYHAVRHEDGRSGTVFKSTFEGELPDMINILQPVESDTVFLPEGYQVFVIANEMYRESSSELSFVLPENTAAFQFDLENKYYANIGDPQEDILGGLYERSLDTYYKNILTDTTDEGDISALENWCLYNGIEYKVVMLCGEEADRVLVRMNWFDQEDFDGLLIEMGGEKTDLTIRLPMPEGLIGSYLVEVNGNEGLVYSTYFDGREISEVSYLDLPISRRGKEPLTVKITSEVTGKSVIYAALDVDYEKGTAEVKGELNKEGLLEITPVEDESISVEISDKGGLIEGFEGYNIEQSEVYYSSVTGISIVFSISKADGTPFPEDYLENNSLELIYGDLNPFMSAVQADELNIGQSRLSEDRKSVKVAMSTAHAVDPSKIDTGKDIPIQVNSIVENGAVVAEGLYEANFRFGKIET